LKKYNPRKVLQRSNELQKIKILGKKIKLSALSTTKVKKSIFFAYFSICVHGFLALNRQIEVGQLQKV
jgi:hypothetical protein